MTLMRTIAGLMVICCSGCISLRLEHSHIEEPLHDEQIDALAPGTTKLADALRTLGAPMLVWEYRADGMALAWSWSEDTRFAFSLSYSFAPRTPSASFQWSDATLDRPGCVLWFDQDLVLRGARRGKLRDLGPERRRPAASNDAIP